MKILLKLLRERFDRIIIDAPPAWPLADVSVISPLADWVLWICRSGEIPKGMFQHTVQQIQRVQPNIIGVVMNAVDLHRDRYYYYGYPNYYYSSRYYRYRYHHTDYYGSSESGEPTENSPQ
jgi:Mrp family chromosome partitioning ATPase